MKILEKSSRTVLENLRRGKVYAKDCYFSFDPRKQRISIRQVQTGDRLSLEKLEQVFRDEDVRACEFDDLGRHVRKATSIAGFSRMMANRVVVEIAKKIPSPWFKNLMYRTIGVNIPSPSEVIVAPNVFMDYLYPDLVTLNAGTFIGEEAFVMAHYFTPQKFLIGPVSIGEDCLVGARSMILPGVEISDGVQIGANAVVGKDLDYNVKPGSSVLYS